MFFFPYVRRSMHLMSLHIMNFFRNIGKKTEAVKFTQGVDVPLLLEKLITINTKTKLTVPDLIESFIGRHINLWFLPEILISGIHIRILLRSRTMRSLPVSCLSDKKNSKFFTRIVTGDEKSVL